MTNSHAERRRFVRIAFDAPAVLRQGNRHWNAQVLDLSFKGLLVSMPKDWDGDREKTFDIDIKLHDLIDIFMIAELRHVEGTHLGFECRYISLESIGHLRRLIELNLGDERELERELGALVCLTSFTGTTRPTLPLGD